MDWLKMVRFRQPHSAGMSRHGSLPLPNPLDSWSPLAFRRTSAGEDYERITSPFGSLAFPRGRLGTRFFGGFIPGRPATGRVQKPAWTDLVRSAQAGDLQSPSLRKTQKRREEEPEKLRGSFPRGESFADPAAAEQHEHAQATEQRAARLRHGHQGNAAVGPGAIVDLVAGG
jgi:hypothetical protein